RPVRLNRLAQRPDSVYEAISYDADSRMVRRTARTGATTVRQDSTLYDASSRALAEMFSGEGVSYAPLGPVRASSLLTGSETFTSDALGNHLQSTGTGGVLRSVYEAGSARLLRLARSSPADTTTYSYDYVGKLGDVDAKHWVDANHFTA